LSAVCAGAVDCVLHEIDCVDKIGPNHDDERHQIDGRPLCEHRCLCDATWPRVQSAMERSRKHDRVNLNTLIEMQQQNGRAHLSLLSFLR